MDADLVVHLGRQALWTALLVAGPLLLVSLAVGLVIGVLQAATQIGEQSLVFIPKVVAVMLVALALGPWMLARLVAYATGLLAELPRLAR